MICLTVPKISMTNFWIFSISLFLMTNCTVEPESNAPEKGKSVVLKLKPSNGNPRNSEGSFIRLRDGRILFIYSHFTDGSGDYASAYLASRSSDDDGKTWAQEDVNILPNEGGLNTMSVSLLRLQNGDIALFYARKNSHKDCRPILRISKDEAATWSDPIECIRDQIGYYVLNNDRVIQLSSGRLIMPVSLHEAPGMEWSDGGRLQTWYSDDNGLTWTAGIEVENPDGVVLQEPGVIALKDGKIMMFIRTDAGAQYLAYSSDAGHSWSPAVRSDIPSPLSPASIKRIPSTGDLLMAWNNNEGDDENIAGKRTPFNLAISSDEGKTWKLSKTIEDNPDGWYCYTAIDFVGDQVLLGYCAGDRRENNGLAETYIARIGVDWIYDEDGIERK